MTMSFQVSDPALQLLKDTLISTRTDDEQVLRLIAQNSEFSLGLSHPEDGDLRFESEGTLVLTADEDVAELLDNVTIDVETIDGQARLYLAA
jgi:hypothetical protein